MSYIRSVVVLLLVCYALPFRLNGQNTRTYRFVVLEVSTEANDAGTINLIQDKGKRIQRYTGQLLQRFLGNGSNYINILDPSVIDSWGDHHSYNTKKPAAGNAQISFYVQPVLYEYNSSRIRRKLELSFYLGSCVDNRRMITSFDFGSHLLNSIEEQYSQIIHRNLSKKIEILNGFQGLYLDDNECFFF